MRRSQLKSESVGFGWILYFKSFGFGFVTQSQLVQFCKVKNAKFCLKFKGMY